MTRMFSAGGLTFLMASLLLVSPALAEEPVQTNKVIPQALFEYVSQPDGEFRWSKEETITTPLGTIYRLNLVSQKWQGIVWQHALMVYEPEKIVHPDQMLLFVTGGSIGKLPKPQDYPLGLQLAQLCGARVAMLHQVPNQPLLENRKEDDLISETWLKYLQTGDATWPLLFPMVKSATRAMDALEVFSKQEFQQQVDGFVVTGASKRGWTSWLTAAADKRIIATAPMVIDILNFPAQMKHQKETWGFYSEQIADYSRKGLLHKDGIPQHGREGALWAMMDPYTYRSRLTMPKLLIVGANDRYWAVDAMSLYWNDLPGPKAQHRVANAGHNLDDGGNGRLHALQTLAVFFRLSVAHKEFPQLDWTLTKNASSLHLTATASEPPKKARLWHCTSMSNDFRDSKWSSEPLSQQEGTYSGSLTPLPNEHAAIYGEFDFTYEGIDYSLSTLVEWK